MNPTRKLAAELLLEFEMRPEKNPLDLAEGYMRLAQIIQLQELFDDATRERCT
ncbi:MAG: hypothetical protein QQN63_03340 [Nitrosopumilus sp.]